MPRAFACAAPALVEVRLPADLANGCELVTSGVLDPRTGREGSVQLQIVAGKPPRQSELTPSTVTVTVTGGQWTSDNRQVAYDVPILANPGTAAYQRIEAALDEFRRLFPAALCYTKIVPVDEVVTLTLFYREDDHLCRLMLDDAQQAQLDRLWDELHYDQPGRADAGRRLGAVDRICHAGRRSQGLRAAARTDQRARRRVSPAR